MSKPSPKQVAAVAVTKWLFFAVLVSTAPLLARWWNAGAGFTWGILKQVGGRGELYLVAAALTGEAIGEAMFGKAAGWLIRIFKIISIGSCLVIVYLSASAYQRIADLLDARVCYGTAEIALQSLILFILALIAACGCISIGCNAK